MVKQREVVNPFDIRNRRAMVSLGPLSPKKYCTYSCPFCYVQADFLSYASLTVDEIIQWLKNAAEPFDIIYVSGDTDSFAAPRTANGLKLLKELTQFDVDILFTTRFVFEFEHLKKLQEIQQILADKKKLLFGCGSVAQLSFPHLEPKPIRPPADRIEQLGKFKSMGIVSVLAMRPFLPVVPTSEYLEIVDRAKNNVDVILGEVWYADQGGLLEQRVFQGPTPDNIGFVEHQMDFDTNAVIWKVYEAEDVEQVVEDHCTRLGIPFFMRSSPAIEWARQNKLCDLA